MKMSAAKLDANRRNARKSTGPRTVQGKKTSSRNATTHGIFCNDLLLPHEDPKEFKALRDAFLYDHRPRSFTEMMLVDRIVTAAWKLKRLNRVEELITGTYIEKARLLAEDETTDLLPIVRAYLKAEYISGDEAQAQMFCDDGTRVVERLMRYGHQLELSMHRALRELEKVQKRTQSKEVSPLMEMMFMPTLPSEDDEESDESETPNEPKDEPKDEPEDKPQPDRSAIASPALRVTQLNSNGDPSFADLCAKAKDTPPTGPSAEKPHFEPENAPIRQNE